MKDFFSLIPGYFHFNLFGILHILITIIPIIAIILIYRYKDKIKAWKYHDKFIRYLIVFVMFTNMAIYYGSEIVQGYWNYKVHLPLHFCFISGYFFMFTLITNNKKLFKLAYFFSFAGPLPAIILPDLICGPDRFIFWTFFLSHQFFVIASMYCLYVLDWKIEKKDISKAFIVANMYFLFIFIFNIIFNTNYIMTNNLPEHVIRLMPFLKYFDYPIVWLEIAGLLAIVVAYIPVHFYNKKKH